MKEGFKKSLIEAIISSIVAQALVFLLSEGLRSLLGFFNVEFPFDLVQFFQIQFPIWVTLLFVSIVVLTFAFLIRSRERRKQGGFVMTIRKRPRNILDEGTFTAFGVDWDVLFGSFSINDEPYGFVENGPLCPKCKYEMDYKTRAHLFGKKRRIWYCLSCQKEYGVPNDVEDVSGAVEKLVDAHFRKKRRT